MVTGLSDDKRITKTEVNQVLTKDLKDGVYHFPEGITSIGNNAFVICSEELIHTDIPNSVISIGQLAFVRCHNLQQMVIPESVTKIGNLAFFQCTGLTQVVILNSEISVGQRVFEGCTNLVQLRVPAETSLKTLYFLSEECNSLRHIIIESNNFVKIPPDSKEYKRLIKLVIPAPVYQFQQAILDNFFLKVQVQIPELDSGTKRVASNFIYRDIDIYPAYKEFADEVYNIPIPTSEAEFEEYKKALRSLSETHLGRLQDNEAKFEADKKHYVEIYLGRSPPVNQAIRKLESYLRSMEKKIPINFLVDDTKTSKNPANAKILQTRLVIIDIISQLNENGSFEISKTKMDLINEKEKLKTIVSNLSNALSKQADSTNKEEKASLASPGKNPHSTFKPEANQEKSAKKWPTVTPPHKPFRG